MFSYVFLQSAAEKAWLIPDLVLTSDGLHLCSDPHLQLLLFQVYFDMTWTCAQSLHPSSSTSIRHSA